MIEIRLPQGSWHYDPNLHLGSKGGFGEVFAGKGNGHDSLAIKRLYITASEAAHRELRIADDLAHRRLKNVMPILDAGQDTESDFYFLVMPRAEKSLQEEITRVGSFSETETLEILQQITSGLLEISDLVHRDLKPSNILYYEGKWKIADFGISRFVEESTSLNTLKESLTPAYAAPEQWLLERATNATDIYALGCIAYTLLTGRPPFLAQSPEDYRDQHIHVQPPLLNNIQPRPQTLIISMLRKPAQARPSLQRVSNLLIDISQESAKAQSSGFQSLAQAGAADAEASSRADVARMAQNKLQRERQELADNALHILRGLTDLFYKKCSDVALTIERTDNRPNMPRFDEEIFAARLGRASIQIKLLTPFAGPKVISKNTFSQSGWDVVLGAIITVTQPEPKHYIWGANLWYTNLGKGIEFRWWEVPYFTVVPREGKLPFTPHAVTDIRDADLAASKVSHVIAFAAQPKPIDDENAEEFCDRWAEILAKAYNGQLSYPSHLPFS